MRTCNAAARLIYRYRWDLVTWIGSGCVYVTITRTFLLSRTSVTIDVVVGVLLTIGCAFATWRRQRHAGFREETWSQLDLALDALFALGAAIGLITLTLWCLRVLDGYLWPIASITILIVAISVQLTGPGRY